MRRSVSVKLHDILIGGSIGTVLALVLVQSIDLIPSVVTGIILGISVAYASRTVSKSAND